MLLKCADACVDSASDVYATTCDTIISLRAREVPIFTLPASFACRSRRLTHAGSLYHARRRQQMAQSVAICFIRLPDMLRFSTARDVCSGEISAPYALPYATAFTIYRPLCYTRAC